MTKDSTPPPNEQTRVDLGEDLLEPTRLTPRGSEKAEPASVADLLQSARILLNEGFLEEAKKTLREILIREANNALARKQLEEIHELELKQILSSTERRRSKLSADPALEEEGRASSIQADRILRELDEELKLSLFENPEQEKQFFGNIDREMHEATPRDRMDLGIGFMEMGLYGPAAHLFRSLIETLEPEYVLAGSALLAQILIAQGKGYEAIASLQPALRDNELARDRKIELFYLVGRAYQSLRKLPEAASWYQATHDLSPGYRDVQDRLRDIAKQLHPPVR